MQLSLLKLFSTVSVLASGVQASPDAFKLPGFSLFARYTNSTVPAAPVEDSSNSITATFSSNSSSSSLNSRSIPYLSSGYSTPNVATRSENIRTSAGSTLTTLPTSNRLYNSTAGATPVPSNRSITLREQGYNSTDPSNSAIIYPSGSVKVGTEALTTTQSAIISTGTTLIPVGGASTMDSTKTGVDVSTKTQSALVSTGVNLISADGNSTSYAPSTGIKTSAKTIAAEIDTCESLSEIKGTVTAAPLSTETATLENDSTILLTITSCLEGPCYSSSIESPVTSIAAASFPDQDINETKMSLTIQQSSSISSTPDIRTINVASQANFTHQALSIYDGAGNIIKVQTVIPLAFALGMALI